MTSLCHVLWAVYKKRLEGERKDKHYLDLILKRLSISKDEIIFNTDSCCPVLHNLRINHLKKGM